MPLQISRSRDSHVANGKIVMWSSVEGGIRPPASATRTSVLRPIAPPYHGRLVSAGRLGTPMPKPCRGDKHALCRYRGHENCRSTSTRALRHPRQCARGMERTQMSGYIASHTRQYHRPTRQHSGTACVALCHTTGRTLRIAAPFSCPLPLHKHRVSRSRSPGTCGARNAVLFPKQGNRRFRVSKPPDAISYTRPRKVWSTLAPVAPVILTR